MEVKKILVKPKSEPAPETKPNKVSNWAIFQDTKAIYTNLAQRHAVDLTPERSKWNIIKIWTFEITMGVFLSIAAASFIHEYKEGREDFVSSCRNGILIFGTAGMSLSAWFLYLYNAQVGKLVEYCDKLSKTITFDEEGLFKTVRALDRFSIIFPIFNSIGVVVVSIVFNERPLPIPFTFLRHLMETNLYWYYFIVFYITIINFIFWLDVAYLISTYYIFMKHIAAQYDTLSEMVRNLVGPTADEKEISKKLNEIGSAHVELMDMLDTTSKVYQFPLLELEFFYVIVLTITGVVFQYEISEFVFGIQTSILCCITFVYPYFGQGVSQGGEDFALAISECEYDRLSPKKRRELSLLCLMAQREVGVTIGGFHNSNYLQMSMVSLRNFLISFSNVQLKGQEVSEFLCFLTFTSARVFYFRFLYLQNFIKFPFGQGSFSLDFSVFNI